MDYNWLAINILATLLAIPMLQPTYLNLFGNKVRNGGQIFIFEMDRVMGGLMGVSNHYSKFEGILLLSALILMMLGWTPVGGWSYGYLVPCGYMIVGTYMWVCGVYAVIIKDKDFMIVGFLFGTIYTGLAQWRLQVLVAQEKKMFNYYFMLGCLVFLLLSTVLMCMNKNACKQVIRKLHQLKQFQKQEGESFNWQVGDPEPVGFQFDEHASQSLLDQYNQEQQQKQ